MSPADESTQVVAAAAHGVSKGGGVRSDKLSPEQKAEIARKGEAPVADNILIAEATRTIFDAREQFLVVALTGRTGSGCSTVAGLLGTQKFAELERSSRPTPASTQEERKDRVVAHWLDKHWRPFSRIGVSDVIAAFAFEKANEFEGYAAGVLGRTLPSNCVEVVKGAESEALRAAKVLQNLPRAKDADIHDAYAFYYGMLPRLAINVRNTIGGGRDDGYTRLFQALGDNLRISGTALGGTPKPDNLFSVPRRIHALVELGRRCNKLKNVAQDYFVVDALRHPFEIRYLREKVARFYVMAVTTTDAIRRRRLADMLYRMDEVDALDAKEYPERKSEFKKDPPARPDLKGYAKFISQDIQACLNVSDIYVSNVGERRELAWSIARYVSLMQHPGLVTPTAIERCMQAAYAARLNSGCISRQVGAVVTDKTFSIKAVGWNDPPRGQVQCSLRYSRDLLKLDNDYNVFSEYERSEEFRNRLSKDNKQLGKFEAVDGRHLVYCFKAVYNKVTGENNQVHTRALHAEENAFLQIAKHGGQALEGGNLFTTSSPCELCAKKAYQVGIARVFYVDPYPGISSAHVLGVGANAPGLTLFSGVIGRAYHDLYEPLLPYKDEVNMLQTTQPMRQEHLPLGSPSPSTDTSESAPTGATAESEGETRSE